MRAMIISSDNAAANQLEVAFGGSTSGGSARVNAMMRSLGLVDSEMYGGYATENPRASAAIPIRVDEQPSIQAGKYTTAADLGRLLQYVYLAAGGRGPLISTYGGSFSPAEARYLLYLLVHVTDGGKLDRYLQGEYDARPQGRLDRDGSSRQRHRVLARRGIRGGRDDLQPGRRRHGVGRARRPDSAQQPRPLSGSAPRLTPRSRLPCGHDHRRRDCAGRRHRDRGRLVRLARLRAARRACPPRRARRHRRSGRLRRSRVRPRPRDGPMGLGGARRRASAASSRRPRRRPAALAPQASASPPALGRGGSRPRPRRARRRAAAARRAAAEGTRADARARAGARRCTCWQSRSGGSGRNAGPKPGARRSRRERSSGRVGRREPAPPRSSGSSAWSSDLERAQQQLKARLEDAHPAPGRRARRARGAAGRPRQGGRDPGRGAADGDRQGQGGSRAPRRRGVRQRRRPRSRRTPPSAAAPSTRSVSG